jgi:hypothetical protein
MTTLFTVPRVAVPPERIEESKSPRIEPRGLAKAVFLHLEDLIDSPLD